MIQSALFVAGLIALMVFLHRLLLRWLGLAPKNFRQKLIFLFTFLGGIYFFLEWLLPENIGEFKFGAFHQEIILGVRLFGSMAIGLGIINLLRVHGSNLIKSKRGWPNSLALIAALFTVFVIYAMDFSSQEERYQELQQIGILRPYVDEIQKRDERGTHDPVEQLEILKSTLSKMKTESTTGAGFLVIDESTPETDRLAEVLQQRFEESITKTQALQSDYQLKAFGPSQTGLLKLSLINLEQAARDVAQHNYQQSEVKTVSEFVFQGFFLPLGSSMFSLLAFYVATAAYRTFRIRSVEAGVMMLTAVLVMLGQIPHGPLYVSESLPGIRLWILEYINTPAFRAIFLGSAVAALAMAMRMWFSLDASPLSVDDDRETEART